MLVPYTLQELKDAFNSVMRAAQTSLDTGDKSDVGVIAQTARLMWQGAQVAAVYVYNQLIPADADQTSRERLQELHGTARTRAAAKARGHLVLYELSGAGADTEVAAGTTLTTTAFWLGPEIVANVVLTSTANVRTPSWTGKTVGTGSTSRCVFVRPNVSGMAAGDVCTISGILRIIRFVDEHANAIHFYPWANLDGAPTAGTALVARRGGIAEWEAETAGLDSYLPPFTELDVTDYASDIEYGIIVDCGGMGDEIALDEAHDLKHLEDEIAGHAGHANAQYYREIALRCPDVQLDDAIVYTGVRGPGSVDIVAVGRSGGFVFDDHPDLQTRHFTGGYRFIGDVAAKLVEDHVKSQSTPYLADVRVVALEPDFSGQSRDDGTVAETWSTVMEPLAFVTPMPGYECDVPSLGGYVWSISSLTTVGDDDYPRRVNTTVAIPDGLEPGMRVCVAYPYIGSISTGRAPFFTRVARVTNIDPDARAWFDVDLPLFGAFSGDGFWMPAGPLTQPVIDAVHDLFDSLGPGAFLEQPVSVGYAQNFSITAPYSDVERRSLVRWPPEHRRLPAGIRTTDFIRAISSIEGVRAVTVSSRGEFLDLDPMPLHRLVPRGVIVAYTGPYVI